MINPPYNNAKRWLIKQHFFLLLLYWVGLYFLMGIFFGCFYWVLDYLEPNTVIPIIKDSERNWSDFFHFSFATQATVGYGDFSPIGWLARLIAAMQAGIGIVLNALILGVTTYKLIKSTNPIYFPNELVYDPQRDTFWFRFINWDADGVRDANIEITAYQPNKNFEGAYDTVVKKVELEYSKPSWIPSVHLFSLRTVTNNGANRGKIDDGNSREETIRLSPLNIAEDITIRLDISGYFQTTGDAFATRQYYYFKDIRCGQYAGVDHNNLKTYSKKEKVKYIQQRFNRIEKTLEADCENCNFYNQGCPLDVRSEIRAAEKSNQIKNGG